MNVSRFEVPRAAELVLPHVAALVGGHAERCVLQLAERGGVEAAPYGNDCLAGGRLPAERGGVNFNGKMTFALKNENVSLR